MLKVGDVELMLATHGRTIPKDGWIYELKYDGYRVAVGKVGKTIELITRTRNKKDATNWFPALSVQSKSIPGNFIVDAEVCALDSQGRPDFEAMRRAIRTQAKEMNLGMFVFDVLAIGQNDVRSLALLERKELLRKLIVKAPIFRKLLSSTTSNQMGRRFFAKRYVSEWKGSSLNVPRQCTHRAGPKIG